MTPSESFLYSFNPKHMYQSITHYKSEKLVLELFQLTLRPTNGQNLQRIKRLWNTQSYTEYLFHILTLKYEGYTVKRSIEISRGGGGG